MTYISHPFNWIRGLQEQDSFPLELSTYKFKVGVFKKWCCTTKKHQVYY